jgi:prepilin-type N-terminal cleavage/methylation domain-containing protein
MKQNKNKAFTPLEIKVNGAAKKSLKGFTLVEMVVTILLVSILAFAVTYIFMEGFRSYIMNRNIIDLRSGLRVALKRMVFEIRESEINPTEIAGGFKIQADVDDDGTAETIIYQLVGTNIRRTVGDTPEANAPILLGSVSSANFPGLGTNTVTLDITASRMDDQVHIRTKVRARCI